MAKKKKIFPIMKLMVQLFVLSFIGLLFWASFWWADYSNPMESLEINFSETKVLDVNHYKSLLDEITNNDLSKLSLYEISALIENHPYIKVARVSRHYPSEKQGEIISSVVIFHRKSSFDFISFAGSFSFFDTLF